MEVLALFLSLALIVLVSYTLLFFRPVSHSRLGCGECLVEGQDEEEEQPESASFEDLPSPSVQGDNDGAEMLDKVGHLLWPSPGTACAATDLQASL